MPRKNKTGVLVKKKTTIPRALREQVWLINIGKQFERKCIVDWCHNQMNVFDFHVGHNIPESQGGETNIFNLKPICARCNLSMSNQYSIEEWSKIGQKTPKSYPTVPVIKSVKKPWWLFCS